MPIPAQWAATPGPDRPALLRRVARVVDDNSAELETWLVREGGAVPGKAAFEACTCFPEVATPGPPWPGTPTRP
jgi:benzaldehyde dehydrogenase (NAD)